MPSDVVAASVITEGGVQPAVHLGVAADPAALHTWARAMCDERWPHWSRSYSGVIAVVAGWHRRVGIDVEVLHRPAPPSWSIDDEDFRSAIMTPDERKQLLTLHDADARAAAVSLWCSKEALAKALGTPMHMDPARLTGPAAWGDEVRGGWHARRMDATVLDCDGVAWLVYES